MNVCQKIQSCSSISKKICEAFKTSLNCWEVEKVPCCRRMNKERCDTCSVYLVNESEG